MKISQREARKLRNRVQELERVLEDQRSAWVREWPGGTNIDTIKVLPEEWHIVSTARKLKHAVVVMPVENPATDKFQLCVYAMPLPSLKGEKS